MSRPRVTFAMRPAALARDLFGREMGRVEQLAVVGTTVLTEFDSPAARFDLARTEILLAGWGSPRLSPHLLDTMPGLRAVLFAGGTAAMVIDPDEAHRRGIACADAGDANAVAVAEYTFAMILLANKRARYAESLYRERRSTIDRELELRQTGNYRVKVGLIGASRIGRRVAALLALTDLEVLIYDPYASHAAIAALGARKCELDELLEAAHVVSIHAPETPETRHMFGPEQLARLRDGAVLINTARGALVDQDALMTHLRTGRLDAVLDVTAPEPLPADHEMWSLPNVTLTPHIAGATGNELRRIGAAIVDELERLVRSVVVQRRTA